MRHINSFNTFSWCTPVRQSGMPLRRRKQEDHIASRRAAWTESLLARWQVTQKQAWFSSHEKGNPGPALLILHPRRRFGAGFFGDLVTNFIDSTAPGIEHFKTMSD